MRIRNNLREHLDQVIKRPDLGALSDHFAIKKIRKEQQAVRAVWHTVQLHREYEQRRLRERHARTGQLQFKSGPKLSLSQVSAFSQGLLIMKSRCQIFNIPLLHAWPKESLRKGPARKGICCHFCPNCFPRFVASPSTVMQASLDPFPVWHPRYRRTAEQHGTWLKPGSVRGRLKVPGEGR